MDNKFLQETKFTRNEFREYTNAASRVAMLALASVACINISILLMFLSKYYSVFVGYLGFTLFLSSWFMLSISTKLVETMHNVFHYTDIINKEIDLENVINYVKTLHKSVNIYSGIHVTIAIVSISVGIYTIYELGVYGDMKVLDVLICFLLMVLLSLPKIQIFLSLNKFSNWITEKFVELVGRNS